MCLPRPQRLRQPEAWAPSPRVRRAFSLRGERPRQPEVWAGLSTGVACNFPPQRAAQAARGLHALSPGAACLFPPRPQCAPPVGSQEVFRQEPGACLQCGRGWLLWGWVCPFPLPPASYLQRGWAGSSLEFLSPFVLRTAGGVFRPVNFSALPQFKKAPSDYSQGLPAGPYPKQCCPLLSVSPPLAGGGCGRLGYFSAGSCF